MNVKKNPLYLNYGMYTIGGVKNSFSVSFAGATAPGWTSFYKNKAPWRRWFTNPIFQNRSGYDPMLKRHRAWFILMWFIFRW